MKTPVENLHQRLEPLFFNSWVVEEMALFEARQRGIHPFCITIDEQARDYLPHMYGDANYVVIDDIRKLPYRISDIYPGLTS